MRRPSFTGGAAQRPVVEAVE